MVIEMNIPKLKLIYRMIHIDNLSVCLKRHGFHASNFIPEDGLCYKTIHNVEIQNTRHIRNIPCDPFGTLHDYVPFYLGPRSPMLLQLHTGRVEGYNKGQEPLIYIVSDVQLVNNSDVKFVFSDGHGIASFTSWYNDLKDLDKVDWDTVYTNYWYDDVDNPDRQRRKQAEFLIQKFCPIDIIKGLAVYSEENQVKVQNILNEFGIDKPVKIIKKWYY